MMRLSWLSLLLSMLMMACQLSPEKDLSTTVDVTGGTIEGVVDSASGVHSFKGIPFASPPVGDLRWRAPQPVEVWQGIRQCREFGPSPVQTPPRPFMFWSEEFLIPKQPIDEDCLYLNVWTAAKRPAERLPVLVYIYGGGFVSGGAGCPIYDGTAMAKKGVVFVSINYRVGRFGFFAHPTLTQESGYGSSGNYAILDMIAVLKWVKENIGAFGGDASNVTIAGQSAGAVGVNILCASPLAKGLFHRAIAQSGAGFYQHMPGSNMTLEGAEQLGVSFAESLGDGSIESLRAISADTILYAEGPGWPLFQDGYVLDERIAKTYALNRQNDVPLLVGWNGDDVVTGPAESEEAFKSSVALQFGDLADQALEVYPATSTQEAAESSLSLNRDSYFAVQMHGWAKHQSEFGQSPVFVYNFNRQVPAHTPATAFGAFHSGEVVYAYDNLHTLDRPWQEVDHQIAEQMSDYWVNFTKAGDPNGENLTNWPAFTAEGQRVLAIDETIQAMALPMSEEKLRFWDKYLNQ